MTPGPTRSRWMRTVACAALVLTAVAATFQDELLETEELVKSGDVEAGMAAARELQARALAEYGPESPETARALRALAIAHEMAREFDAADSLYREALGILRAHAHPDTAKVRDSMGVLAARLGDYPLAITHYEAGLAGRIDAVGPESVELVGFMNNLARAHSRLGNHAAAESLLVRALGILRGAAEPDSAREIQTLQSLTNAYFAMGDLEAGARAARDGVSLAEATHGPESRVLARLLRIQGVIDRTAGRVDEAVARHERALAIFEASPTTTPIEMAEVCNALSTDHEARGGFVEAREFLTRAVSVMEAAYGPDHPQTAVPLVNLGVHLAGAGEYLEARDVFLRVLAIDEAAFGAEHGAVGQDLMNLGSLAYIGGDTERALRFLERARPIYEASVPAEHVSLGVFYTNLGTVRAGSGDLDGGLELLERGLAILEKTAPETLDYATQLTEHAHLLLERGDVDGARASAARALSTAEAVVPGHPTVGLAELNLASILATAGDYDEAIAHADRAVEIYRATRGESHPALARALLGRAYVHHARGEIDAALDDALTADAIGLAHLAVMASGLSEREALRYAAYRPSGVDLAITCAVEGSFRSARIAKVWDAVVRSRARVLDEMAARRLGASTDDPLVREAVETLGRARARLANLVVHGGDSELNTRMIDEAREERERDERRLAELSAPFRRQETRAGVGLDEVLASLPSGEAIVAFARYRHAREDERYVAFVRAAGASEVTLIALGDADGIDDAVRAWRTSIRRGAVPPGPLLTTAAERTDDAGRALRQLVWDPVAPLVGDATHVHVVPAGMLHLVAFDALPDGSGGFLVESAPPLRRTGTERDLTAASPRHRERSSGLLALGDPDFDARGEALIAGAAEGASSAPAGTSEVVRFRGIRSACGSFETLHFDRLPATARELASVRETLGGTTAQGEITVLTGGAASEEAFKRLAGEHRRLHVATHGFFIGGECRSATEISPDAWDVSGEDRPLSTEVENPLVLSGLALAGANVRSDVGEGEDGIVTAEEISSLDLSGTSLVVLSACDTGIGTLEAGEGVLGLSRAFLVAGAETLVLTLWAIDDDVSEQWMRGFYGALAAGESPTDAARRAELELLRARRAAGYPGHPFYWAPFTITG